MALKLYALADSLMKDYHHIYTARWEARTNDFASAKAQIRLPDANDNTNS